MITKSAAYQAAINANTRMADFTAQFGFVPPGAVEGAVASSGAGASYSQPQQVLNGLRMGAFWRNLGDWPLNGETTAIDGSGELGFWSGSLSADDGSLTDCYLSVGFDADYDLIGCTIMFDLAADEWAVDFVVIYYDAGGVELARAAVANNDSPQVIVDLQAQGVRMVRIEMSKWCLPRARARIAEFLPGQIFGFGLLNSFALLTTDSANFWANSFETSELSLIFDNSDKKFDFLNPNGVFAFLRQKMKLNTEIGLNIGGSYDFTPSGDRYLFEIPGDEQTQTAELSCRPAVAFAEMDMATPPGNANVGEVVAGLWAQAGLSESCTVDSSLAGIACNRYAGENIPINDALAQIALTAGGWWFIDRHGNLELRPIPLSIPTEAVATLSYDDMFTKPVITQNPRVTAVRIGYTYDDGWNEGLKSKTTVFTNGTNDGSQVEAISVFTNTAARAEAIGQMVLDYHAARRLSFSISYRGDPALEVGDTISVETDFGFHNIIIVEHTLTLDGSGFLRGTIKGVG